MIPPAEKYFHVYKSSAGSGKTYTLVREYLKIVLREPQAVRHILAITFTNAAAAEMKSRIIESLAEIASLQEIQAKPGKAEQLLEALLNDWHKTATYLPSRKEIIDNARTVLRQILHNYSNFSVSTIDSFIHRVVRTFAFDLKIPMNFEVEMDTEALLNLAIDRLILQVGHNQQLTDLLVEYMISQADDELDIRIETKIAKMAKTLTEEDGVGYVELLSSLDMDTFRSVAKNIRNKIKGIERRIQTEAKAAFSLINAQQISDTAFYYGKKGIYSYFSNLADGRIMEKIHPNSHVIKTIEEDNWTSGKCTEDEKQSIMSIRDALIEHYTNIQNALGKGLDQYINMQQVWPNIFPLAVLNEVEKMLSEIKAEQNILHISDFNKSIARIIAEEPVPFIYERLGERYRHYMIDEFQDTSALQWQNLLPLVENGLAEGKLSLVVGDGKQAIYRFRNGDVTQFAELPYLTPDIGAVAKEQWEVTLKNNYREIPLDTNWRSTTEIVHFNNRFFLHNRQYLGENLGRIYENPDQQARKDKPGGYVRVEFAEDDEENNLNEVISVRVLEVIAECRQLGYPLQDITILCPTNKAGSQLAVMLMENQIPVISKDSLLLSHSGEVNFFLSMLRILSNPQDTVAALEIVGFLLDSKLISKPESLHECLLYTGLYGKKDPSANTSWHKGVEKLLHHNGIELSFKDFNHHNVYDTCETILRQFFAAQSPPNPFVAFFMEAVYDYTVKHVQSFDGFLAWWETRQSTFSLIVPEGIDAVQVMTVHKSKGLQFPVVIFPFAYKAKKKPTKSGFWISGDLAGIPELPAAWIKYAKTLEASAFAEKLAEEEGKTMLDHFNATYVALTRPSEKLFILTRKEKKYPTDDIPGQMKSFLESEGMWNNEQSIYEFGQASHAFKPTQTGAASESPLKVLLSGSWSRALRMRSHQAERSTVISGNDPLERGNLLHRAMESINTSDDVEMVLQTMHQRGEIDALTLREWTEKIMQLITQDAIAPCFAPGARLKTEPGMYDKNGHFYRPDRVVFLDKETLILDYKTGRQYTKHQEQMDTYASILQAMGYPSVKKIILYLDEGKAKSV